MVSDFMDWFSMIFLMIAGYVVGRIIEGLIHDYRLKKKRKLNIRCIKCGKPKEEHYEFYDEFDNKEFHCYKGLSAVFTPQCISCQKQKGGLNSSQP